VTGSATRGTTVGAVAILIGAWALATGIIEVSIAFGQGETAGERVMWALTGVVSLALGVVLFIRPDVGALSLATVFGLFSIVYGICALILSAQFRLVSVTAREMPHRRGDWGGGGRTAERPPPVTGSSRAVHLGQGVRQPRQQWRSP
jgi:Short repeat of unknown function (DUF308)